MRIAAILMCVLTMSVGESVSADSSLFNGIQQDASPDIVSVFGTLSYNTFTDALQITAFPSNINVPGGLVTNDGSNTFVLNAVIPMLTLSDLDGKAITGTLDIKGKVPGLGFNTGNLLQGNVTAFRSPSASQMEFLFTITGGEAAMLFGGNNDVGIVVIPAITPFYDRFFTTDYLAGDLKFSTDTASTTIVPEPGSFLLAMFGIVGIAGGARLRRNRRLQS